MTPAAVPPPREAGPSAAVRTKSPKDLRDAVTVVQVLVAPDAASMVSGAVAELSIDLGGVVGDRHHGLTRPSGSREVRFYPRGTTIRNRRQVSVLSVEELTEVAARLGVAHLEPGWLGANVVVDGLPELSTLSAGTRLLLPGGVGLVCEGVNQPCAQAAAVVADALDLPAVARGFVRAAYGRRGIVASVERPGILRAGAVLRVVPPELHAFAT